MGWNVLAMGMNEQLKCRFKAQYRTYMSLQNLFSQNPFGIFQFVSMKHAVWSAFQGRLSEPVQICGWRVVARFHGQSHPHLSGNVLRVLEKILAGHR